MELKDDSPMPYGAHKGTAMANVPADYLLWLKKMDKCTYPVKIYIEDNIDALRNEIDNCK